MTKAMLISHMPPELKEEFKALNAITGVSMERLYKIAMQHGIAAIKKDFKLLSKNPYIRIKANGNQ